MKPGSETIFGALIVGVLVSGFGYLFYLQIGADHSDCPQQAPRFDEMLESRATILTLSAQLEKDVCAAYRAHLANLEKVRSVSIRCAGWVGDSGRVERPQRGPSDLMIEENFYRRLLPEKCG